MITDRSLEHRLRELERRLDDLRTNQLQLGETAVLKAAGWVGEDTTVESSVTLTTSDADLATVTLTVPDWVTSLSVIAFGFVTWGFSDLSTNEWNEALSHIRIDGTDSENTSESKRAAGSHSTGNGFIHSTLYCAFSRTISSPASSIDVALRGSYLAGGSGGSLLSFPVSLSVFAVGSA